MKKDFAACRYILGAKQSISAVVAQADKIHANRTSELEWYDTGPLTGIICVGTRCALQKSLHLM